MKKSTLVVLMVIITFTGCTRDTEAVSTTRTALQTTTSTTAPTTRTTTSTSSPPRTIPVDNSSFGTLVEVASLAEDAVYAGPDHPSSLDGVAVEDWIAEFLVTDGAENKLTANGFVVVPGSTRLFHEVYDAAKYGGGPVFVTTDAAYHVWHLAFDKILRETEQRTLLPELEAMVARLVELARAQVDELAGTALEESAGRVAQFYEVAATLLDLDVGEIGPRATREVELALDAEAVAVSPTIGVDLESDFMTVKTDYSLFRPRGHYTLNANLERYFRAMSQLGSNAFLLEAESLQLGVLASRVLLTDPDVAAQWATIYAPTAFLVGAADDYTPFELGSVIEKTVPSGWDDLGVFADPDVLGEIGAGLRDLRSVAINPEAASVRIMGTRLVVDSYILDQLVMPNVADRWTASPLDLAAAFGSDWAYRQLTSAGETEFGGYADQLSSMQELVAERTMDDWGKTAYDSWLYAIEPMWQPHGSGFPSFMRTEAWDAKSHQTGFASYTELKHDTILYTKQAVAEGGGDGVPVPPRHWVEPDPVAYERLAGAANLLRSGLEGRSLLPEEYRALLADLERFYLWLGRIARDELAGVPISDEDNDELGWVGSTLEGFWLRTSDFDLSFENGPDTHAALIADVMRNPEAVLELGTGYVDNIFVLVPDDEGRFQVAVGGVYSYYEFWNEGPRLTDEEWRAMLDAGGAPERPTWQASFISGDPPSPAGLSPGLLCRAVAAKGYTFWDASIYWVSEGSPARMDADGNGIPCESVFPANDIDAFLQWGRDFSTGLGCANLNLPDEPGEYHRAIAYWMLEGTPGRMDEDGNGIPCETVFSPATVEQALGGLTNIGP